MGRSHVLPKRRVTSSPKRSKRCASRAWIASMSIRDMYLQRVCFSRGSFSDMILVIYVDDVLMGCQHVPTLAPAERRIHGARALPTWRRALERVMASTSCAVFLAILCFCLSIFFYMRVPPEYLQEVVKDLRPTKKTDGWTPKIR